MFSKDGNRSHAFLTLVKNNQGIINSLCNCYYKQIQDRNDIRQEIVLQLWKAFPNYRGDSKAGTWIYRISLNTIISHLRKTKLRFQEIPSDYAVAVHYADDDQQLLSLILDSITAEEKALLILNLEGYNHQEIAGILGISATNASTRFHRLKEKLKKKFSTTYHELK